jgi:hypothetical protein
MSIVYLRVGPYTTLPPRQVRGHEPIPNAKMDPSPENRQTKKKEAPTGSGDAAVD